jgi:hypothetical protein
MNERIKELWDLSRNPSGRGHDEQKFAELLIQQCMACSTWVGKMNTNSVEPVHTAHAINQRIKQHFGVEE